MSILLVILIISFLIIIHELGHFFFAKKHGIKVEEFGIGYPPKLFKLFTWQGTIFTFNLVPLGGFVKMEGEDGVATKNQTQVKNQEKNKSIKAKTSSKKSILPKTAPFYTKSFKQKISVILAGPLVNFLFGLAAFTVIFFNIGIPQQLDNQPRIAALTLNSPAAEANLPLQTAVEAVQAPNDLKPIKANTIVQVKEFVKANQGQTITLFLSNECQQESCSSAMKPYQVYLRTNEEIPEGEGSMGVMFADFYFKFYPWWQMPFRGAVYGIQQAVSLGFLILITLFQIFNDLFTGGGLPAGVAGPIGIVHQAQQHNLAGQDFFTLLNFSAMLSINLAIMNLLPIPALDGGRALFILLEKFLGRKKIEKVEAYVNYGGFVLLIALMVLVTVRDVSNWIG